MTVAEWLDRMNLNKYLAMFTKNQAYLARAYIRMKVTRKVLQTRPSVEGPTLGAATDLTPYIA